MFSLDTVKPTVVAFSLAVVAAGFLLGCSRTDSGRSSFNTTVSDRIVDATSHTKILQRLHEGDAQSAQQLTEAQLSADVRALAALLDQHPDARQREAIIRTLYGVSLIKGPQPLQSADPTSQAKVDAILKSATDEWHANYEKKP